MKYRTETGVTINIANDASELDVYKACRAAGLLRNQTHSALVYGLHEEQITIDRGCDGLPILTLDRVTCDA